MPGRVATFSKGEANRPQIGQPRLVGRDRELSQVAAALAARPAVVLIEGEAGIGKTRLVREFMATAAAGESQVLVAACPPFRKALTLGPLVDALRTAVTGVAGLALSALAGALRPLFPEWASLPPAPEPLEDAAAARQRLFSALAELLDRLGTGVILVEDVHWADEATLEFLLFLACRPPRQLSLVITCRPEDVPASSILPRLSRLAAGAEGCRVTLGPLDTAGTAALVSSMLGGEPVGQEFAAFVHERTEGVPLAVEESVLLMGERAELARRQGRWVRRDLGELHVPPTVRDAVLERAGWLAEDTQAVLRAAAVLAAPASEQTLAAVAALPAERARSGLCEALSCGLLAEETAPGRPVLVSFRHILASRAVYESVPGPHRRELHLRAGRALEGEVPPPLARLARHFQAAGDRARWCRHAELAADTALAAGDEALAADLLYELATHPGLTAPELVRLVGKMRFAAVSGSARYREVARILRGVLDSGNLATDVAAEARYRLARVLLAIDDWSAGRVELERAIPHLAHDPVSAAWAMITLGCPSGTICPAAEHLTWLRRAAQVKPPAAARDRLMLLGNRASALLLLGEEEGWAEAATIPGDASTSGERLQVTRAHINMGESALTWGRYAEAGQWLASALELAEKHQYLRYRSIILMSQIRLDWFTGVWDGLTERAAALAATADLLPATRLEASLVLGLTHAAVGANARAREHLGQVLEETREQGVIHRSIESAGALARLSLASGRIDEALEVTGDLVALVAANGIWLWAAEIAPVRVRALCAVGRIDEAAELATAFAWGLTGRNVPTAKAALATCQAILAKARGEHTWAGALFARAAAAWQAMPRRYEASLAREAQAHCLLAAGQRETGLAMLHDLREELVTLGALGDADRVVFTLREHGEQAKRPQRGGRGAFHGRLSPWEAEVVRLLAQGQTDREVAASLFLSPKTVASHVESARRKLKVPSRTALVAAVIRADA